METSTEVLLMEATCPQRAAELEVSKLASYIAATLWWETGQTGLGHLELCLL